MALVIADRVRETTTTTGTGSVTLGGAYTSFQTFSAAIGNANSTYYTIASATSGEWEVGIGTYTSSGNTLSRDTVLASSTGGTKVSFSSGTKDVFVTQPAERSLLVQSAGSGLFAGAAAFTANGLLYANATTTVATSSNLTFDGTTLTANALTVTNNPTLSGGTANGVAYLNGSKVLTSGSALTFDGTSLSVVGGGSITVNKNATLQLLAFSARNSTQRYDIYVDQDNTGSNSWSLFDATNSQTTLRYFPGASGYWQFLQNNAEQMRLTSTGLGIGTTASSGRLMVRPSSDAPNTIQLLGDGNTLAGSIGFDNASGSVGNFRLLANNSMTFYTNGSERARIDSSGNLGLGVTPSGWDTARRAIQLGGTVSYFAANSVAVMSANMYFGGPDTYIGTGYATQYAQSAGQHQWYTAPSGTAGNAISFTQAMTLDASGRLMLGTTVADTISTAGMTIGGAASGTDNTQPYNNSFFNIKNTDRTTNNLTVMYFDGLSSGGNIRGLGAIGMKTTSWTDGAINSDMVFWTSGSGTVTERARIDSSGNLLVGTTTTGLGNTSGFGFNASQYLSIGHANGTGTGTEYISFGYNGTKIGSITQNGTTGVLYNITSDYRLKDVVGAVSGSGARIDALKPVDYTWKADGSSARGFLAHQFQDVYPGSVTGTKDAVDEDGNPVYQQMQASTTEVIADLVAELQSLRKRVAQLEGK